MKAKTSKSNDTTDTSDPRNGFFPFSLLLPRSQGQRNGKLTDIERRKIVIFLFPPPPQKKIENEFEGMI